MKFSIFMMTLLSPVLFHFAHTKELSSSTAMAAPLTPIPVRGLVLMIDIPGKDFTLQETSGRITRYSLAKKARVIPSSRHLGMPAAASLEGIRVGDRCAVTAEPQDGEQVTTLVDCVL